jgi:hypothetical protein
MGRFESRDHEDYLGWASTGLVGMMVDYLQGQVQFTPVPSFN